MRYLVLLFFLLFGFNIHSQNIELIDSLKVELKNRTPDDSIKVNILIQLYEKLMFSKPEEALKYSLLELDISKTIGYKKGIATGNMHIGQYYGNRNENDSALYYYTKAKKYFKDIHNIRGLIFINHSLSAIKQAEGDLDAAIQITRETLKLIDKHEEEGALKTKFIGAQHNVLSGIYNEKGSYKIALIEALKALKCFESINHEARKADVIKQIGDIEAALENYKTSINYYNHAINIYEKLGEKMYLAYTFNSLGMVYQNLKNYESARAYYNLAIDYSETVEDKLSLSTVLNNLAELEIIQQNYPKAKELLMQAKSISENEHFDLSLASSYDGLSQIEYHSNNYAGALEYNRQAMTITKTNGALPHLQQLYKFRSQLLESSNQYKEAIHYLKASQKLNDSLFSSKKIEQIEELKTIYEIEKKEQEIKNQKNEIELLNIRNKISRQQLLLLALGFLLALIAIYAFYQRSKKHKLEKEKVNADLEFKTKELATHALHLAKKNEVLNDLKQKAKILKADADADPGYQMLIQTINFDLQDDNNWENFSRYFEEVYKDFNVKAQQKYPNITANDLRLMSLMKMNLSSKEIANILNISSDGIKKARQRLRKKMGIDSKESLESTVINI